MKHVYLIQSISHPEQRYVGITADLKTRLTDHNNGQSPHTSKYRPWKLVTSVTFTDDKKSQRVWKLFKIRLWSCLRQQTPLV